MKHRRPEQVKGAMLLAQRYPWYCGLLSTFRFLDGYHRVARIGIPKDDLSQRLTLQYNERIFELLSESECCEILHHEFLHPLLNHCHCEEDKYFPDFERARKTAPDRWELASDLAVNDLINRGHLKDAKLPWKLPENLKLPKGLSTGEYFDRLTDLDKLEKKKEKEAGQGSLPPDTKSEDEDRKKLEKLQDEMSEKAKGRQEQSEKQETGDEQEQGQDEGAEGEPEQEQDTGEAEPEQGEPQEPEQEQGADEAEGQPEAGEQEITDEGPEEPEVAEVEPISISQEQSPPQLPQEAIDQIAAALLEPAGFVDRTPGTISLSVEQKTVIQFRAKVNWRQQLHNYLRNFVTSTKQRVSWKKINKRTFDFPGQTRRYMPKVLVALDVSGSINDQQFLEFCSELKELQRYCRPDFVQCDTEIKWQGRLSAWLKAPARHGGGGTRFDEVIKLARQKYGLLIYFTDGCAPDPRVRFANTVWVLCDSGRYGGEGQVRGWGWGRVIMLPT